VFLITRTDPTLPKHKGLTMFLVPTSAQGFERQPLPTIGDETTNISYYSDIRLPDRYRIGEVNNGWSTLHGPLDAEHHLGEHGNKLDAVGPGANIVHNLARSVDAALRWAKDAPAGDGLLADDEEFLAGIGRLLTEMEGSACTPTAMGKVKRSDTARLGFEQLIDMIGPAATLPRARTARSATASSSSATGRPSTARPPAARSRCSGPSSPSTIWASRGRNIPAAGCSCRAIVPPRQRRSVIGTGRSSPERCWTGPDLQVDFLLRRDYRKVADAAG
jgi:hypothetical protein